MIALTFSIYWWFQNRKPEWGGEVVKQELCEEAQVHGLSSKGISHCHLSSPQAGAGLRGPCLAQPLKHHQSWLRPPLHSLAPSCSADQMTVKTQSSRSDCSLPWPVVGCDKEGNILHLPVCQYGAASLLKTTSFRSLQTNSYVSL